MPRYLLLSIEVSCTILTVFSFSLKTLYWNEITLRNFCKKMQIGTVRETTLESQI